MAAAPSPRTPSPSPRSTQDVLEDFLKLVRGGSPRRQRGSVSGEGMREKGLGKYLWSGVKCYTAANGQQLPPPHRCRGRKRAIRLFTIRSLGLGRRGRRLDCRASFFSSFLLLRTFFSSVCYGARIRIWVRLLSTVFVLRVLCVLCWRIGFYDSTPVLLGWGFGNCFERGVILWDWCYDTVLFNAMEYGLWGD